MGIGVGLASSVAAVAALAWVRLRRCGHSSAPAAVVSGQQEMEWDNSTFNITINPLDHDVRLFPSLFHHRVGLLVLESPRHMCGKTSIQFICQVRPTP